MSVQYHSNLNSIKILSGISMTQRKLSRSLDGKKDVRRSLALTLFSILGMLFEDANFLHKLLTAFFNVIFVCSLLI